MAAAEARAAWQRAANRYFVQEDAKRAPKLACCQSSTSSSKVVDAGPANTADAPHRVVGRMPFNSIPSYSNLPPDAKWWLQMQPNNDHQRGPNFQQVDAGIADVESSSPVKMNADLPIREMATMSEESIKDVLYKDLESFMDVKKHPESRLDELNVVDSNKVDQDFLEVKNMTDYYEYLEMEMVGSSVSKQTSEFSSKTDSSWIGGENVPWWRVTDGEDLASFVAQKSFHHVENCDLPPPQKIHQRKEGELYKQAKSIDHDTVFMSSLEWESRSDAISSPSSAASHRKHWSSVQGLSHTGHAASKPMRIVELVTMKRKERWWMYDRYDNGRNLRLEFLRGVDEFIEFCKANPESPGKDEVRCPCPKCKNRRMHDADTVKVHLYRKGFIPDYYGWYSHGEELPQSAQEPSNPYREMIFDALANNPEPSNVEEPSGLDEESNPRAKVFLDLLKASKEPMYERSSMSVLEMTSRIVPLNCEYNLPHRCVDAFVGKGEIAANKKAKQISETYNKKLDDCIIQGSEPNPDLLYCETVGGRNKGKVQELGQGDHLYYNSSFGRKDGS